MAPKNPGPKRDPDKKKTKKPELTEEKKRKAKEARAASTEHENLMQRIRCLWRGSPHDLPTRTPVRTEHVKFIS